MTTEGSADAAGGCSADSDGEVAETVGVVTFERKRETAERIVEELDDAYAVTIVPYEEDVFAANWGTYDCLVALMATGIVMRKTAGLLEDKWADPAIVVVDEALTWAIPLTGGHHGANQVARDLAALGAVPTMTTASEVAGEQSVERKATALNARVVNGDSTVATNLAVLNDDLGPVARLDGPRAVLVDDDVTVLQRAGEDGVVLGTGTVSGVDRDQVLAAWEAVLADMDLGHEDVEFVATATRKADETGLFEAAEAIDAGVVCFEKDTLEAHEGPSPSRSAALIGWPGIAEAAAIAGGRNHDLCRRKERFDEAVTVAVGR